MINFIYKMRWPAATIGSIGILLMLFFLNIVAGCQKKDVPDRPSDNAGRWDTGDFLDGTDTETGCREADDCDGDGVAVRQDCDDDDPEAFQKAYFDRDGDGYRTEDDSAAIRCVGAALPPNWVDRVASTDCDDDDETIWRRACLDEDGDHYCLPDSDICVGEEVPYGYVVEYERFRDCDDRDPSVQQWAYLDEDGDDEQSDTPVLCASADDPRFLDGSFEEGLDCDDQDPLIATYRPDVFGDGIDDNCDGQDGFEMSCMTIGITDCRCYEENNYSEQIVRSCEEGVDLAIIDYHLCVDGCNFYRAYMTVANQGGQPFEGEVIIQYKTHSYDDGAGWVIPPYSEISNLEKSYSLKLGPSELVHVVIDSLCQSVSVRVPSGEDCDIYNNAAIIRLPEPISCP